MMRLFSVKTHYHQQSQPNSNIMCMVPGELSTFWLQRDRGKPYIKVLLIQCGESPGLQILPTIAERVFGNQSSQSHCSTVRQISCWGNDVETSIFYQRLKKKKTVENHKKRKEPKSKKKSSFSQIYITSNIKHWKKLVKEIF